MLVKPNLIMPANIKQCTPIPTTMLQLAYSPLQIISIILRVGQNQMKIDPIV